MYMAHYREAFVLSRSIAKTDMIAKEIRNKKLKAA